MSSRDVQRVLKEKNVNADLTTVRKAIDAAGFCFIQTPLLSAHKRR